MTNVQHYIAKKAFRRLRVASTVDLTGKAHSFSEREAADRTAWAAPGINR